MLLKTKKTKPSFNPEGWISYNFLTATLSCWEIWDRWSERESCSQRLLLSKSFTSLSTHILKPKSTSMGTPDRKTPTVCGKGTVLPHQSRDDPLSLELKSYYYGEAWPNPQNKDTCIPVSFLVCFILLSCTVNYRANVKEHYTETDISTLILTPFSLCLSPVFPLLRLICSWDCWLPEKKGEKKKKEAVTINK